MPVGGIYPTINTLHLFLDDVDKGIGTYADMVQSFSVDGLSAGIHTYRVSFPGDENFSPTEVTGSWEVIKFNSSILSINVDDTTYPNKAVIEAFVTSGTTGQVSCRVYNGETSQTLSGTLESDPYIIAVGPENIPAMRVRIDAWGLAVGTYNVEATYLGDENFNPSAPATTQFSVFPQNP